MSTVRVQRRIQFTTVANNITNDETLSLKAKGLMLILLSKPDGWEFHIEPLIKLSKDGRDSFYSAFNELKKAGYVNKYPVRKSNGQVEKYITIVSDEKITENPLAEKPETVDSMRDFGNEDNGKAVSGKSGNSKTVSGYVDTSNTYLSNTDFTHTDGIKKESKYVLPAIYNAAAKLESYDQIIEKILPKERYEETHHQLGMWLQKMAMKKTKIMNADLEEELFQLCVLGGWTDSKMSEIVERARKGGHATFVPLPKSTARGN